MAVVEKLRFKKPLELESGGSIQNFELAYQTFGKLNKDKSNVVWVFHPLSANTDVTDWWAGLFGPQKVFDTGKYFVVCTNAIGSPYGSSKPKNLQFPNYTIRDVIKANLELAEELKIYDVFTCIGASFGGNLALEFSYSYPGEIENLVLVASSAKESAWAIAIHESQRIALKSDPTFGQEGGGENGMKAARAAALLNYRTADSFINQQTDNGEKVEDFKAASYIRYQGDKFVKRFDALSYYYLMNCLDSHNIGRQRGGSINALRKIKSNTLVVGIKTDVLVPTSLQRLLVEHIPNSKYVELDSSYGHDAFLVEQDYLNEKIEEFIWQRKKLTESNRRTVLKFGGKSLANGEPINQVIDIIKNELKNGPLSVVVSARGSSTDQLLELHDLAINGKRYEDKLEAFFQYQIEDSDIDLTEEKDELSSILYALSQIGSSDYLALDRVVSFGELISIKYLANKLQFESVNAVAVDSRELIHTTLQENGEFAVDFVKSRKATKDILGQFKANVLPIISGYIASSEEGKTVTLGRNGSNYSATLIASFTNAKAVQNWTDVDGVYSANPKYVPEAVHIDQMSYREANELANFGTSVLHPKTILPLMESDIPLYIKSSSNPELSGTLINKQGAENGIKAVSAVEDVALISIEGRGLLGNVGIDGRIFSALSKKEISVRLISQASSERGIGFVVNKNEARKTELLLQKEFEEEIKRRDISDISVNSEIAIIAIVGRHNYSLEKAISGLRSNKIWMHLISNSISGEHISLVVDNKSLKKAIKVIHNEVFGVIKTVNLVAFGKGVVGGELIDQIVNTSEDLERKRGLKINVVGVVDSKKLLFNEHGVSNNWREELNASNLSNSTNSILSCIDEAALANVVIADNTASEELPSQYIQYVRKGFDIVASNKKGNSIGYDFYENLRRTLDQRGKRFYYETNVGAGLPIIDTIRNLFHSSDSITKIRGVFSGSLSYLFNTYSVSEAPFSEILIKAKEQGFTEPDPREDLCGLDVARKLIILAREIGFKCDLDDVEVENLVPETMRSFDSYNEFISHSNLLDSYYGNIKDHLLENEVLRYVGELDLVEEKLTVKLVKTSLDSPLGGIKNADAIIEIFTEGYGDQPIVVQGAGAGANVTARGVYSDILKIGKEL